MYKYVIIAALVAAAGAYGWHTYQVNERVKEAESEIVQEYSNGALEQALSTVALERDIARETVKVERKANDEKQAIIDRRDALIRSLQQRPKREDTKSTVPESGVSCPSSTGAELYREDGEFLAGEAARAQELVTQRNYYYEQYMILFNKQNKETPK